MVQIQVPPEQLHWWFVGAGTPMPAPPDAGMKVALPPLGINAISAAPAPPVAAIIGILAPD